MVPYCDLANHATDNNSTFCISRDFKRWAVCRCCCGGDGRCARQQCLQCTMCRCKQLWLGAPLMCTPCCAAMHKHVLYHTTPYSGRLQLAAKGEPGTVSATGFAAACAVLCCAAPCSFSLRSLRDVTRGEELTISYGAEKPNNESLRDYGFTLAGNSHDRIQWGTAKGAEAQAAEQDKLRELFGLNEACLMEVGKGAAGVPQAWAV